MIYIIQENVFREVHYNKLEEAISSLDLENITVRVLPFVDKIVNIKDIPLDNNFDADQISDIVLPEGKVFCFGAIKLARISRDLAWKPGSMMNENHNYMVYKDYWKDNLLNYDSKIYKLTDDFEWLEGEVKFIRPTEDSKAFTGQVFTKIEWDDMLENYLHNYRSLIFNEETLVQVCVPKNVQKEIRCWVVGSKVISASTYRVYNEFNISGIVYQEELDYAQSMVDIFQLNEAFVIDICVTDGKFKIVEAGCINCAGFYNADMQKVIMSIEDHFNPNIIS